MSKDRARRRAAALAEREAAAAEAERRRARRARWERLRLPMPKGRFLAPRRQRRPRRHGALPVRVRVLLALGWLALQALAWQLTDVPAQRLGVALLSLLALPLVVVLTVPTSVRRSYHS